MSLWLRGFFFFAAVSVLGLAQAALAFVDQPEGCWSKVKDEGSCAVRVSKREWLVSSEGTKVLLGAGSGLIRSKAGEEWQILVGQVWLESEKAVQVRYLQQTFRVQGESWWVKSSDQIKVTVFSGSVETQFNSAVNELVPAGFENWWQLGSRGVIKPVQVSKTLRDWNRWTRLSKKESKARLQAYRELWADRAQVGSELYQAIIDRRLASAESREKAEQMRRLRAAQEQQKMRKMFRARFDNP
ncbi:MAG: hypothetical protein ACK5P7_08165 [Bdellovibrio sp.]|jgi:hypothetical protein